MPPPWPSIHRRVELKGLMKPAPPSPRWDTGLLSGEARRDDLGENEPFVRLSSPVAVWLAGTGAVAFAQIHADQIAAAGGIAAKRQQIQNVFEKPAHHLFSTRATSSAQTAVRLNWARPVSSKISLTRGCQMCPKCDKIAQKRAKLTHLGTLSCGGSFRQRVVFGLSPVLVTVPIYGML